MDPAIYDSLTPMERNCLRLAQHDRKSEQIAHALGIAASTVNTHIFSARRKMGGLARLTAADRLREYEASQASSTSPTTSAEADTLADAPQQTLSRHPTWMAGGVDDGAVRTSPAEVREERTTFTFDDVVLHSGGQERNRVDPLHRVLLLLAIAVLTALILIAAPAIYDSAAERIANSLERPHAR